LARLTKTEKLKLIFHALDKKNKEFKRKTLGADYALDYDVEFKKNPLTGKCTEKVRFRFKQKSE
jgi:hypothetical protein